MGNRWDCHGRVDSDHGREEDGRWCSVAPHRMDRSLQNGSHRRLRRPGWAHYTFAFHDGGEVGPGLLTQIAKKPGNLRTYSNGIDPKQGGRWSALSRPC